MRDLLVDLAADDEFENLTLTRSERRDLGAHDVQPAPLGACDSMLRQCPLDRAQQLFGRYRLGQKILRSGLDRLDGCPDIGMAGEEDDRQTGAECIEANLQFGTAQPRYLDVQQDTTRCVPVRQMLQ